MEKGVLSTTRADVYRSVTDAIVKAIEAGAGTFVMPWHSKGPLTSRPVNALTKNRYRGINVVALWAAAQLADFTSGYFASFLQWKELGARVMRGARGSTVVFYRDLRPNDDDASPTIEAANDEESARRFVAKASYVFNADQVEGWKPPGETALTNQVDVLDNVEAFIASTNADIRHGGSIACYRPLHDRIHLPPREVFVGSPTLTPTASYYATLLHELIHWTGAKHRLDRTFGTKFGDDAYAAEELVAEIGAAFLCADLSVTNEPRPDHAAYLAGWLTILKSDTRAIFQAASLASKASEYLLAFSSPQGATA